MSRKNFRQQNDKSFDVIIQKTLTFFSLPPYAINCITKEYKSKVSFPQAKHVGNPSGKKDSGQAGMTNNGSLTYEPN